MKIVTIAKKRRGRDTPVMEAFRSKEAFHSPGGIGSVVILERSAETRHEKAPPLQETQALRASGPLPDNERGEQENGEWDDWPPAA